MILNVKQQNLLIWQGDDFGLSLDLSADYPDLAGYQLRAQIRDGWEDNAALLAVLAVTPLAAGVARINLLKADSAVLAATCTPPDIPKKDIAAFPIAKLPAGAVVWDLQLTDLTGVAITVRWGYVLVVKEVTIESSIPNPPVIDPTNPYPQYLTEAEASSLYAPIGGGGGGGILVTLVYTPANNYALPISPVNPATVQVFINGGKQVYGLDYNIIGTVLNWISPNLTLSASDTIEVYVYP
jgi:hypothetical protein